MNDGRRNPQEEIERLKSSDKWVPAVQPSQRPTMAYPMIDSQSLPALSDSHLTALDTIRETSTPFDRAVAFLVKIALLWALWFCVCVGLFIVLEGDTLIIPVLLFVGLCTVSYVWLHRQELDYSAVGLERHKADLSHDLASQREENDSNRKDKMLDAYIRSLLKGD